MLNKRGYTLVELLSVLVIISIIALIIIPVSLHSLDISNDKVEEAFKVRIKDLVDTYILFNIKNVELKEEGTMNEKYLKTITLKDVLLYNDISNIVNPKNNMGCNIGTLIDIYKDKNNNYCFKIESLECLTQDKSINTCK